MTQATLERDQAARCGASCLVTGDGGATYMRARLDGDHYLLEQPPGKALLRCSGLVGHASPGLPASPAGFTVCEPFALAETMRRRRDLFD